MKTKNTFIVMRKYFLILEWGADYSLQTLVNDLIGGIVITLMLIPQSLAYAQLAGLPAEIGAKIFAKQAEKITEEVLA